MGPESKEKHTKFIEERLIAAEAHLKSLEEARNSSESRKTSRYDTQREIFANDVSVQEGIIARIKEFHTFLQNSAPCSQIQEGAEFTAELWDEGDMLVDVIYSPIVVNLPNTPIITPQSPIGRAISGMVTGNTFVYQLNGKLMAGIIKEIK